MAQSGIAQIGKSQNNLMQATVTFPQAFASAPTAAAHHPPGLELFHPEHHGYLRCDGHLGEHHFVQGEHLPG